MSPCPTCGKVAQHAGVFVDWKSARVYVDHVCLNPSCRQNGFREAAQDQAVVLAKVGLRPMNESEKVEAWRLRSADPGRGVGVH